MKGKGKCLPRHLLSSSHHPRCDDQACAGHTVRCDIRHISSSDCRVASFLSHLSQAFPFPFRPWCTYAEKKRVELYTPKNGQDCFPIARFPAGRPAQSLAQKLIQPNPPCHGGECEYQNMLVMAGGRWTNPEAQEPLFRADQSPESNYGLLN